MNKNQQANTLSEILRHTIQSLLLLPQWYAQKWHKRDPYLWTFDAWSGTRYSDNPRALYEYVLAHEPAIHPVWMTNNPEIYERLKAENKPVAMRNSSEGIRIQKDAGFFFCTHGRLNGQSEGELQYMNGIRYINVWHGAPLKLVGDDENTFKGSPTTWKRFKTRIRKLIVPWEFLTDTILCSEKFFEPFFRTAYGRSYPNILTCPELRLDKFRISTQEKLIQSLNTRFNDPIKIVYMPTFRDTEMGHFNPFAQADFDQQRLEKVLKERNMVFLYKGHFLGGDASSNGIHTRIQTINDSDYDDLYTFIKDVDILITDYSSIYFDFLCLRKPMILFPFDYEDYTKRSRGFYFDYSLLEAKKVYSWQELETCLLTGTYHIPSEEEVQRFRPTPIGHNCETLVNYLLPTL